MKKLTVLIDMDDTIENLCEVWVNYLNERYGTDVLLNDVREWDITKAFPTLSRGEIFEPLCEECLWKRITPLPGAVENIQKLIDDGHKVVIVTTSHPDTISMKLNNVLFKYFPYFTCDDVIITSQKQLVKGDILIDDAPHNLENGDYLKLLFDAPHNQSYDETNEDMIRVHNWNEAYDAVNCIANLKC